MVKTITMSKSIFLFIVLLSLSCNADKHSEPGFSYHNTYRSVGEIQPPDGYSRVLQDSGSFGEWIRNIRLKSDNHVYLYNGSLKENQSAQFAVLDMPIGKRDLQQCADAVMRLRAEYLFSQKKYEQIIFWDNNGKQYKWTGGADINQFSKYLENVFGWCGTASLEKQLKAVKDLKQMLVGDVFIKGGYPGHAMIVIDMAENDKGEKIYMLGQSYMPAQDIHIVKNPANKKLSPWYEVSDAEEIVTPEYKFYKGQLKQW